MTTSNKISRYWTLIEVFGTAAALYNHRTHTLIYNWVHRPDCGDLAVNSFEELGTDTFYNKLESIKKLNDNA